jgi:hypothetical protein
MIQTILKLFKQAPPDWKKPIRLEYNDNILTVTTLDQNIVQYYHAINDAVDHNYVWQRYNSRKTIKDQALINILDGYYSKVLRGKRNREGWVVTL